MSGRPRQLALDLPHRIAMRREDFLLSESNRAAWNVIQGWLDWPEHRAALVGPAGSGKTHLAAIWAAEVGALSLSGERLVDADLAQTMTKPALMIDDADQIADPDAAERLFHLCNHAAQHNVPMLITGQQAPARWPNILPDLTSRLVTFQLIPVGPPDDELLAAILVKLFHDRQLQVSPDVIDYLLRRLERSVTAAAEAVGSLDRLALGERRRITRDLARQLFACRKPLHEA